MSTKKPRIAVYLEPEVVQVIERHRAAKGLTISAAVSELVLAGAAPSTPVHEAGAKEGPTSIPPAAVALGDAFARLFHAFAQQHTDPRRTPSKSVR